MYCDKCRASSIQHREFIYHCRPCGYDICNDCANREEAKWKEKKLANAFKFDQPDLTEKEKHRCNMFEGKLPPKAGSQQGGGIGGGNAAAPENGMDVSNQGRVRAPPGAHGGG